MFHLFLWYRSKYPPVREVFSEGKKKGTDRPNFPPLPSSFSFMPKKEERKGGRRAAVSPAPPRAGARSMAGGVLSCSKSYPLKEREDFPRPLDPPPSPKKEREREWKKGRGALLSKFRTVG